MSKEDARSLPGAAQAALRNRAVQAVLDGMTQAQAARVFGVHPNAVNRWVKRYRQGGWDALSERRRGRRAGEQAALSASQQQEVIALVRDATPDQLGLPGFLWTREAVAELIAGRYGVRLARTTVGAYLRSWRFEPAKAAAARPGAKPGGGGALAPGGVARHLRPSPPGGRGGGVAGRAGGAFRRCRGPLVGAGRSHPGRQADRQAVWGEPDRRDLQPGAAAVSAVSGSFAGPVLVDFLRRLLRELPGRKVHLVLDGHPVHRAKLVSGWVEQRPTRIQLHFLPGYSPEL